MDYKAQERKRAETWRKKPTQKKKKEQLGGIRGGTGELPSADSNGREGVYTPGQEKEKVRPLTDTIIHGKNGEELSKGTQGERCCYYLRCFTEKQTYGSEIVKKASIKRNQRRHYGTLARSRAPKVICGQQVGSLSRA